MPMVEDFSRTHGAPTERTRTMRRINQHAIGQRHQFVMQAIVEQSRELLRGMGRAKDRPSTSPMKNVSPVSTAQAAPKLFADGSSSVITRQMLSGVWPGVSSARTRMPPTRTSNPSRNATWENWPALPEHLCRYSRPCARPFLVPGDEIGMKMSFKNVPDLEVLLFRRLQINVNVALRIDHGRFAAGADHVRSVRQAIEVELFKIHSAPHRTQSLMRVRF